MSYDFKELPKWEVYENNYIEAKYLGAASNLNVWENYNSSSRKTMWAASHSGQFPVLSGTTPRRICTGVEQEYGKYHSGPVMTEDGTIYATIPKSRNNRHGGKNPSTLVVYYAETGEYNAKEVRQYHSDHPTFGYKLYPNPDIQFNPGTTLGKGTTLASSSNIRNGEYHFGVEANVAFASHAVCIEDGIGVQQQWAKRVCADMITKRTLNFDIFTVALNVFGDEDNYIAYLGLGERVRSNGVLATTREISPDYAFLEMTKNALGTELPSDRSIHVPADSEVIDVSAFEGHVPKSNLLPNVMTRQADEDVAEQSRYFQEILALEKKLRKMNGKHLKLGYEFHRRVTMALSDDPNVVPGHRIKRGYRRNAIKNYRIDFELVSNLKARIGHKLTDLHGGKAILVHMIAAEDASYDKFGTMIDIFIDPLTTNDRINPGRSYEQYFNAYSDQVIRQIKEMSTEEAFRHLMAYYRIISPHHYNLVGTSVAGDAEKERKHVDYVIKHKIEIEMPSNTKGMGVSQVNRLERWNRLDYGPIEYTDLEGVRRTTYDDIIVGSLYMVMLEKIGDDWSTSSVSTNTHFGLPSKINYIDKHSAPVRNQAVRILGESEVRIMLSFMKPEVVKKLLMLSSNPSVVRNAVETILSYDGNSGAIPSMNIELNALNENRAVQYIKQVLYCYGAVIGDGN